MRTHPLAGIYAAALTPLTPDYLPDLAALPGLLDFLARRGCHGALLLGTTGEGPSFSAQERRDVFEAAMAVRTDHPEFRLFGGTGTPSLAETIQITQEAFQIGLDGVVVLPPYYFRAAPVEGLFTWFSMVLRHAVPPGGVLLGYHIPKVSGVPLPVELVDRLRSAHPDKFLGLKDSSGDPSHGAELCARFGSDALIFTGNDKLLSHTLSSGGSGCITAAANLLSPDLRAVWDAHQSGGDHPQAQARLDVSRGVLEGYPPFPPTLKALLARLYNFPEWPVRPPLLPLPQDQVAGLAGELAEASRTT